MSSVYAVRLVFEDDESTTRGAKMAMEKILALVDVVLAPYGSTLTLAVLPLLQTSDKAMFVGAGSSEKILTQLLARL